MNTTAPAHTSTSTSAESPILLVGGTGKVGRRLAARLRVLGRPARVASRSGSPRFDWHDESTWGEALQGTRSLYLATPEDEVPVAEFVPRAVDAGVQRIVALSGRALDEWGDDFGAGMRQVETAVRASEVEWSIMRPTNFNQNFDEYEFRPAILAGELALPTAGVPERFIDAEDIAAVAAVLLTEEGHHGRAYELSGPEGLEFGEAVEIIARASGREVTYRDISPEEYLQFLLDEGVDPDAAASLGAMFSLMRRGVTNPPTDGVREVLGRDPIDFTSYALRAAAALAWEK